MTYFRWIRILVVLAALAGPVQAAVEVAPYAPKSGDRWKILNCDPGGLAVTPQFVHSTYWDLLSLRPVTVTHLSVLPMREAPLPHFVAPSPAWMAATRTVTSFGSNRLLSPPAFLLVDTKRSFPDRLSLTAFSSTYRTYSETRRKILNPQDIPDKLHLGDRYTVRAIDIRYAKRESVTRLTEQIHVVAEGIVLTPAGPRETLLLEVRELLDHEPLLSRGPEDERRISYRFVGKASPGEIARIDGPPGSWNPFFERPAAITVLGGPKNIAQGITIEKAKMPLAAGKLFLAQYYAPVRACGGTTPPLPLTSIDPAWTNAGAMIADTVTRIDPQTGSSLPETWDFVDAATDPVTNGGIDYTPFGEDAVIQVRDQPAGMACPTQCSAQDIVPPYGNGTWQYYLKFDYWNKALPPTRKTRDAYLINDNDTSNPSLDLTLLSQDEFACENFQRVCFSEGPNILAKFLQFNFNGPNWALMWDPVGSGDHWTNSGWSGCRKSGGLALWDSQPAGNCTNAESGFARDGGGCSNPGYGLDFEVVEDGYVRVRAGNIVPALLVRQHTALEPGAYFLFCIRPQANRQWNYDYWWYSEDYGILARVSGPNVTDCSLTPTNWTTTDGAYISFSLFPPYHVSATPCLQGTHVTWTPPLSSDVLRFLDGYKVYWGSTPNSKSFSSGPLPNTQTSFDITGSSLSPIYVSVVSTYTYTDPDLGSSSYESPLSYNLSVTPLAASTFVEGPNLGDGDPPPSPDFIVKLGNEIYFPWEAVAGATAYRLKRGTSKDPSTHTIYADGLTGNTFTTSDGSGADPNTYYYELFALDPCSQQSSD